MSACAPQGQPKAYSEARRRSGNTVYETVASNDQKRDTYRSECSRYKRAMRGGFYLEALLIDYALIEDRLRSWLYHIGVIAERKDTRACKKTKSQILEMMRACGRQDVTSLRLSSVSGKLQIVEATLKWHAANDACPDASVFQSALWRQYDRALDCAGAEETLRALPDWCERRNEVVHGLMSKDLSLLEPQLQPLCEEGFELFRELDKDVRKVSKGHAVRRVLKLPTKNRQ